MCLCLGSTTCGEEYQNAHSQKCVLPNGASVCLLRPRAKKAEKGDRKQLFISLLSFSLQSSISEDQAVPKEQGKREKREMPAKLVQNKHANNDRQRRRLQADSWRPFEIIMNKRKRDNSALHLICQIGVAFQLDHLKLLLRECVPLSTRHILRRVSPFAVCVCEPSYWRQPVRQSDCEQHKLVMGKRRFVAGSAKDNTHKHPNGQTHI